MVNVDYHLGLVVSPVDLVRVQRPAAIAIGQPGDVPPTGVAVEAQPERGQWPQQLLAQPSFRQIAVAGADEDDAFRGPGVPQRPGRRQVGPAREHADRLVRPEADHIRPCRIRYIDVIVLAQGGQQLLVVEKGVVHEPGNLDDALQLVEGRPPDRVLPRKQRQQHVGTELAGRGAQSPIHVRVQPAPVPPLHPKRQLRAEQRQRGNGPEAAGGGVPPGRGVDRQGAHIGP